MYTKLDSNSKVMNNDPMPSQHQEGIGPLGVTYSKLK